MSLWSAIQDVDARRLGAHVFPGFLLYIAILVAMDTATGSKITTDIVSDPISKLDDITSLALIGLFLGTILGMVIDGIGHFIFEERIFRGINTLLTERERMAYRKWMNYFHVVDHNQEPSQEDLYHFADKETNGKSIGQIEESLIKEYYSFFEFYLNSAIAIFFVSLVAPAYMRLVLETSPLVAFITAFIGLSFSFTLLICAYHTFIEYRKKMLSRIESRLRDMTGRNLEPHIEPILGTTRFYRRYILFLVGFGAVIGSLSWLAYSPIAILSQPVTVDRTSIQLVLNETNNWSGHEIINIKNPYNFILTHEKVFAFPYNNISKSITVKLHPVHDPEIMIINIEGKELALESKSYYGMIILKDNNDENPDPFIDMSVIIHNSTTSTSDSVNTEDE